MDCMWVVHNTRTDNIGLGVSRFCASTKMLPSMERWFQLRFEKNAQSPHIAGFVNDGKMTKIDHVGGYPFAFHTHKGVAFLFTSRCFGHTGIDAVCGVYTTSQGCATSGPLDTHTNHSSTRGGNDECHGLCFFRTPAVHHRPMKIETTHHQHKPNP